MYPITPGTASQFRSAEDEVILLVNGFVGFVQAAGVANKTDDDHAETFDESTEQDVLICHRSLYQESSYSLFYYSYTVYIVPRASDFSPSNFIMMCT